MLKARIDPPHRAVKRRIDGPPRAGCNGEVSVLHAVIGVLLASAHGVFLIRGLRLRRRGESPGTVDRIARGISHVFLPLAVLTGFVAGSRGSLSPRPAAGYHIVLGVAPAAAIIVFAFLRPLKKRIPWLLPGLNALLFTAAVMTGLWMEVFS